MENSVKLCIACADACNALIDASKTDSNLDALCKNVKRFVLLAQLNEKHSDMDIAKNVQMLVVNVQQNVKLCLK
jgi:hypothetical protein